MKAERTMFITKITQTASRTDVVMENGGVSYELELSTTRGVKVRMGQSVTIVFDFGGAE